jgi:3-oxoacyl-[acyl-carrier protein] reductase
VIIADRDGAGRRARRRGARRRSDRRARRRDEGADVKAMVDAAEQRFGGIDLLVNNAGMGHLPQPLEGLDEETFDRILALNVKSIYLAAREVVPRFKAKKRA